MKRLFLFCLLVMAFVPTFANGMESSDEETTSKETLPQARIEQVTKDFYINLDYYDKFSSYERLCDRQRHLNTWAKVCSIYGIVCASLGGFDLGLGIAEGDGYVITVGALCATEGIVAAAVGGSLRKKCTKTRNEIMQINSAGLPLTEVKMGDGYIMPTVNVMQDNRTKEMALGVGFSVCF